MSQTSFAVQPGTVSKTRADKIDRIIRRVAPDAGGLYQAAGRVWISIPNKGAPLDAVTQRDITAALDAAGLWPLVK